MSSLTPCTHAAGGVRDHVGHASVQQQGRLACRRLATLRVELRGQQGQCHNVSQIAITMYPG